MRDRTTQDQSHARAHVVSADRAEQTDSEAARTDIGQALLDAINRRREDPATPRCASHYCKGPAMVTRPFDINGEVVHLGLCEDCEDGLLWSSNGYIPTIKKLCEGYNVRTGERRG